MQIGPFSILNPVILAPMAGVTDPVFRAICRDQGAGLTVSEMISADTTLYASEKTRARLSVAEGDDGPRSVQIAGADPDKVAEAAVFNVRAGADIIDINMGCPAKKVCRNLAGSALLGDTALVRRILARTVAAVDVPVTLKIRTGTDRQNRNGVEVARIAEQEGVAALAVHGRTRADRFTGSAEYDTIKAIKQAVSMPVIANGDIRSGADAQAVLAYTGADAVMIGRATQGNPWIFREILDYLQHGHAAKPPDFLEIHGVLKRHLAGLYRLHGDARGVRVARKHIAWYCREKSGVAEFRQAVNLAETRDRQIELVDRFFEHASSRQSGSACTRMYAA